MVEQVDGAGARSGLEVAVVGMAGRFPGADDLAAFWRNLREGVESIAFFTRDELLRAGHDPELVDDADFVPAHGALRGDDEMDAGLFGLTPRDAEILNPQHRVFLECVWSALEHAGYDPAREERPVGVFAGSGINFYLSRLTASGELVRAVGTTRLILANDKDQLGAGVAYRLNLQGPVVTVQTACSTALVSVHLACQSLINGECDLALAGGVSILVPTRTGYLYTPDGIGSPDGRCRAFDAAARGTVRGSGAGVVVLKRLEDAIAEGDTIHAVIRGSAINNDGARKVGFTAPSVTGQAAVISEALSVAGVDAGTVQYLETHGSGTPLGDAVELRAIGQVLARGAGGPPCRIGSVKTNVGHLDAAAGITGLIKTVLALSHREIPPSLNCAVPHPEIEASGGRVIVNTELRPWERNGAPRRAGVSSFGIGGTNAHVVLEEAPPRAPSGPSRELQLLVLSARTGTALAAAAEQLADHLESAAPELADAAFTLQLGRRELEHRLAVVCADGAEGAARLRDAVRRAPPPAPRAGRPVAFAFPGVGTHYVDMGRGLYDAEPAYREAVDVCRELLRPLLDADLRDILFSPGAGGEKEGRGGWDLRRLLGRGGGEREDAPLDETLFAQPAVFVTEYALARLWMSWGVRPQAVMGHSLGEYVAACVAGVMRLEDALELVALRARLIAGLPPGAMLAVPLGEAALRELLPAELDVAAVNTPGSCVVAGPPDEVAAFEAALAERGTVSRRLPAGHAFHSRALRPVAGELERAVAGFDLRAPEVPMVSNVTGTWLTDDQARSPAYWTRHLLATVRFADGLAELRREPGRVLLEVGPGQALGAWAVQHPSAGTAGDRAVFSSLRHQHNGAADTRFLLETLGGLWTAGVAVDWAAFSRGERRHRVPLPGYPFERRRYWVEPEGTDGARGGDDGGPGGEDRRAAAEGGGDAPEEKGPDGMKDGAMTSAAAAPPRREAVLDVLRGIASELTGIGAQEVDTDSDFFTAGFDSLLLLQVIQAIEKRVGVRVSLVELLEEIPTLGAVAAYLDRVLPPGAFAGNGAPAAAEAAPPAASTAAPAPSSAAPEPPQLVPGPPAFYPPPASAPGPDAPAADGVVERVVAQQLHAASQLMLQLAGQQLAAITGRAPAAPAASAPVAPGPASTPAAASAPTSVSAAAAAPSAAASALAGEDRGSAPESALAVRPVPQSPRAKIQPPTFVPFQPVSGEGRGGMTERQRAYLDDFIARYVEKTRGSKAHQARYQRALADTRVTARFRRAWKEMLYPIVSSRAQGSHVWDVDGNEYVDTGMAFGCALFGHGPEFVTRAIREQAERGYGLGPQSPDAGRAAELICELGGNDRAVFCNSGTEAVMGAIRAARTFTGRNRIACFSGSYHGWADVVLGRLVTGGGRREVHPTAPGISPAPLQDVLMLDWDDPASLEVVARHADELAVVMVEPVQSRRLDIQPRAFLHELRGLTREAGPLLLFDELITGFRILPGGAQAYFGVQADLVTYGKIVAGGLPMGVVAGRQEVMDVFDGGPWRYGDDSYPASQRTIFAGAFFKHPLSMAVVCAVLEEVRRGGVPMYERLNERTAGLVRRLNAYFEAEGYPVTTVGFSSSFRFFFADEVQYPDLFNHHLVHEGIYMIPETGTHFLSTAHTDDDVETFFQAVRRSVEAMRRGGFLPEGPGGGRGADGAGDGPLRVDVPAPGAPSPAAADAHPAPGPASAPVARAGADAASAGDAGTGAAAEPAAEEVREDGVRVLPIGDGQRQLWIESQMGDLANQAYIESSSVRLHGALDADALCAALQALVDRHDALRTTFGPGGDVQLVHPSLAVEVAREDFRAAGPAAREARVAEWVRQAVQRPFDLAVGPLVRVSLAAVRDDEHVLVITFHHAILDGWSAGVVMGELGALYAAARDGRPAELAPPPDHAALVRAQARVLAGGAAAQAYWEAEFADGVPVLELPTDHPRPAVRSYRGGRVSRVVDGERMRRLAAAGRPHGLSVFHLLFSAFHLWLSRITGQDDLVVGTPSAGQAASAEGAGLVGYGINVLPIRARVDASLSFVEHARAMRRAVLRGVEHQDFSFPRLAERLLRPRDPSRPPLFAVLIDVNRAPGASLLPGLRAELTSNFGGGSKLDLNLEVVETADALRLDCDYAADLFDRETVERWMTAFERLLQQVASTPQAPVARLELMDAAERALVLEAWNRTDAEYPTGACIHALFEVQAARTPGAVAVRFGEASLTYAELNARANRLAHHLRGLGVGPDARVGVCVERSLELVVSLLAVLKAGGAYVPLDPGLPPERLAYMLDDSAVPLVLVQAALREAVPAREGVAVLAVDARAERLAAEPAENPAGGAGPDSLAYVIYTSGSTGRPKGVMNHHRGVVNLLWSMRGTVAMAPGDRLLAITTLAFDISVLELFLPLLSGARVEILDRAAASDPALLREAVGAGGGTVLQATPATWRLLLDAGWEGGEGLRALSGGEALPAELAARLRARVGALWNVYGPTETTIWSTAQQLGAGADVGRGHASIGAPVANTRVYVVDRSLSPLPAGVPGELLIGGVGVARGYLGRPGLSAEKFVPDPFAAGPGARLYRTGDLARWRPDGTLEFLGRNDHQVKVRGFRIEPGEIEAALRQAPGVADCAVVAREDETGDRRLVAYIVGEAETAALRDRLRRSLPEYMVPQAFVRLERLPLSPSGKLDRRALPAPAYGAEARRVPPATPLEEVLAGFWAAVLGPEEVGATDGFFDLGGHSLLAVRVISRIRAGLGVEVPLRAFFEGPTVRELARRVEALRREGAVQLPPVEPVERTGAPPLSFAQERLWFIERLQPGTSVYNIPLPLRLRGPLDVAALEGALGAVVRRHEALRTTFREVDGAPVQVVAPWDGFALPVDDLSALDEDAREAALRRHAQEDAARPFDLVAGPLVRARLLRLGDDDHALLLCLHHVAADGWSLGILYRELAELYGAAREGREPALPPLPVQYADYAAWQRRHLAGEALDAQLAWWKARLAGAAALLELPADRPRPAVATHRGGLEPVRLSAARAASLQALARREGATLYMVLLAAFQALLARYGGGTDVVVGSPVAGRTRAEVEPLIGPFVNMLAMRTDLGGDPAFGELLRRVRAVTLDAYEHQDLPFEKLVSELRPERSLAHAPIFQVMLGLNNADDPGPLFPGVESEGVAWEVGAARYDLSLELTSTPGGGVAGGLNYSADLFEPATARRIVEHLDRVLQQAAADPAVRLSRLELLDAAERMRVIETWNATDAPPPAAVCIHHLVEAQAGRTPGAVALVFGDEEITYREADARANRLAHHLAALGAGPEVPVGICLERSAEMVIAMLAVLKAGAAYLPLDPGYPAERLAYMLADTGAPLLVTRGAPAGLPSADGVRVVDLDADAAAVAARPADPPRTAVEPANAAWVVYTSGSTGRPKAVVASHASAAFFFAGMDARVGGPVPGTWLAVSRTGFDPHVLELLWTLARGFRVVVAPDVVRAGGEAALAREIRRSGATHLECTTTLASLLVAESGPGALAGVRCVLLGGEPLPPGLAARIAEVVPDGLMNLYGPTESTVWCTTHAVRPREAPVPVGRPIDHARVYVLDEGLAPQPAGVPGELCIGGPGVTRGYRGRPGLTAERFLPDPFSPVPGARMYRSGDRGRWRRDGVLECLGRLDHQVKVRGFRIEPGEIEAALRGHPAVRECAVVAREDGTGDRRLAAYLVAEGEPPSADAVRAHLRGLLPDYMVPASFTVLAALPLNPNGKIDRNALPAPAEAGGGGAAGADEPRDYVEARLIQLWETLLGVQGIGTGQSFFSLGGDSFLALHLFARANRAFGCDLPVATLFTGATVRHMADAIRAQQDAAPAAPAAVVPLQPGGSLPPLFVIHAVDRGVMGYVNLVRHLGPEQPVYGLRDVGDLSRPLARIAADHVADLRAVQPHGPYYLLGWSFGGTVAQEMAVQLEAAGETVAFAGMLDTLVPELIDAWTSTELDNLLTMAQDVADITRRPLSIDRRALEGLDYDEQTRRVAEALREQGAAPPGYDAAALAAQAGELRDRIRSRLGHRPGPFSGTLTLFRAEDVHPNFAAFMASLSDEERRTLGWSRHALGPVDVHPVPGMHVTLGSEPHVRVLAEQVRQALADARARAAAAEEVAP